MADFLPALDQDHEAQAGNP